MSIQAVGWALEQDLPARPKLVLVALANHANHTDGYCWLKAETIAVEASCKRRAVLNFVGDLIRNGYVRKAQRRAEDGRQRANDYWLLLDRAPADWVPRASGDDEADDVPDDIDPVEETPDVVDGVHAVHPSNETAEAPAEPVDKHAHAPGPSAPACTHIDIAEPSKTKPQSPARAGGAVAAATRRYQPPPPQPIAADQNLPSKQIFVFAGTPAYDAWAAHMARKNRTRSWSLTTRASVNGKWAEGWYFPSLFPPEGQPSASTGPPAAA